MTVHGNPHVPPCLHDPRTRRIPFRPRRPRNPALAAVTLRTPSALLLLWPLLAALPAAAGPPTLNDVDAAPVIQLAPNFMKGTTADTRSQPLQFAVSASITADTRSGLWDEPEPGRARWRLRVASEGARSLSFEFEHLNLPAQAELWVFDRHGTDVQGPIPVAGDGSTWSPLVRGDEAIIEASMPATQRDAFAIVVAQAFHGFSDIASVRSFPLDPVSGTGNGGSGACNIDVACSQGSAWQAQARSTVMLMIAGTTLCSGTLISNARQDDRPLVLTANHCGVTNANVGSTIAYFNVQRSTCGSGAWGGLTQNLRGRTLLTNARTGSGSDFALIELASRPPASFSVWYSGVDISGSVPTAGAGIHHPSGDDKKFSRYTAPASAQSDVCIGTRCGLLLPTGFEIDAWAVNWTQGTTEGGSSGSGLWNQDGNLVGTLSGGFSQCASALGNNGGTDYYARLDTAWAQAGAGLLGASLKDVLDPANSRCLRIAGKNPGTAAPLDCSSGQTSTPPAPPVTGPATVNEGSRSGGGSMGLLLSPLLLAALWRRRNPSGLRRRQKHRLNELDEIGVVERRQLRQRVDIVEGGNLHPVRCGVPVAVEP